MKILCFYRIVLLLIVFIVVTKSLEVRVPENLAGTSIFQENLKIEVQRPINKIVEREIKGVVRKVNETEYILVEEEIFLKSLNLCYGAEFFQTLAQVFYRYGNIIDVVKDGNDWTRNFYAEVQQQNPLTYSQANPVGLLVQLLFWQDPGTSSLQNFHISRRCMEVDSNTYAIQWDETLTQWAQTIAAVCFLQGSEDVLIPQTRIEKAWENSFISNLGKKESLKKLFKSCMDWGQKAGFGKDIALRVLIAGVYEMIGNDPAKIRFFYNQLGVALKQINDKGALKSKVTGIDFVTICAISDETPRYTIPKSASIFPSEFNDSWIAFLMLKKMQDGFSPLSYQETTISGMDIRYPDCVETVLRNIACALAMQSDGAFNTDHFKDKVCAFFKEYSGMSVQSSVRAHGEFAFLMSNLPNILYKNKNNDYSYEMRTSFINILAGLNYIFDLKIQDFDTHVISLNAAQKATNQNFIAKILPVVNKKLQEKLRIGLDDDEKVIQVKGIEHFKDIENEEIIFTITCEALKLECSLNCGRHAEIASVISSIRKNLVLPNESEQSIFPYMQEMLTKKKHNALPNVKMVHLRQSPTTSDLETILYSVKNGTACKMLSGMLYAAIAGHYKRDRNVYLTQLAKCVEYGIFCDDDLINEVARSAHQGLENSVVAMQVSALRIMLHLVKNGLKYDEAFLAAREKFNSLNLECRNTALSVLQALIKQNSKIEEIFSVGKDGLQSSDVSVMRNAYNLLCSLVGQGHYYAEILEIVQLNCQHKDAYVREHCLRICKVFVKNDKYCQEISAVAEKLTERFAWEDQYRKALLEVYEALVEKGLCYEQAFNLAKKQMESGDLWSPKTVEKKIALNIVKTLVEKGLYSQEVFELTKQVLQSRSSPDEVKIQSLEVLKSLINKGQCCAEIEQLAQQEMTKSHGLINSKLNELLESVAAR